MKTRSKSKSAKSNAKLMSYLCPEPFNGVLLNGKLYLSHEQSSLKKWTDSILYTGESFEEESFANMFLQYAIKQISKLFQDTMFM